jgi:hypothetical protein
MCQLNIVLQQRIVVACEAFPAGNTLTHFQATPRLQALWLENPIFSADTNPRAGFDPACGLLSVGHRQRPSMRACCFC